MAHCVWSYPYLYKTEYTSSMRNFPYSHWVWKVFECWEKEIIEVSFIIIYSLEKILSDCSQFYKFSELTGEVCSEF